MTKEGSTKIVNFMTPGAGVLMLRCGHISHYSECVVSSTLSMYSTLIANVLRNYDAAFLYHLWFSFTYSIIGLLIYKYKPLWQEVSVKSLILRWPLRPVGLLFYSMMGLLICKYRPFDKKSVYRLSITQVSVKAHGPLVFTRWRSKIYKGISFIYRISEGVKQVR